MCINSQIFLVQPAQRSRQHKNRSFGCTSDQQAPYALTTRVSALLVNEPLCYNVTLVRQHILRGQRTKYVVGYSYTDEVEDDHKVVPIIPMNSLVEERRGAVAVCLFIGPFIANPNHRRYPCAPVLNEETQTNLNFREDSQVEISCIEINL